MQISQGAGLLSGRLKLPRQKILPSSDVENFYRKLGNLNLKTICVSGRCPNRAICFAHRHTSVLILGEVCTRNCLFCSVKKGPKGGDFEFELDAVADLVREMGIRSLVITSVTRDDLGDFGAGHFVSMVNKLKGEFADLKIELLIPDFMGREDLLTRVLALPVEVIGHNIETVGRLYPVVRPMSDFKRSLSVIEYLVRGRRLAKIKSSFMLGLGEEIREVMDLIGILADIGIDSLCIGQYLAPEKHSFRVKKLYDNIAYQELRDFAVAKGIKDVISGPFVRSSFSLEGGRNGF